MSKKITLITGASSGIGLELAWICARNNHNLLLIARHEDKLQELAKAIKEKYRVSVDYLSYDLNKVESAQAIYNYCQGKDLFVNVLINNAGFGSFGFFHDLDGKNEAKMIDVNIKSPVMLTSAFLPKMVQNKKGAIVFLGSVGSYQPTPFFSNYSATKAWNLMFAESLWAEVRKEGVDVICLSPGYTKTEFQENAGAYGQKPLGGWSEPKDVVKRCFSMLGKKPSTIPGFMNWFLAWNIRFTPRRIAPLVSYNLFKPKKVLVKG